MEETKENTSPQQEEKEQEQEQEIDNFQILKSKEDLEFEEQYDNIRRISMRMSYIKESQDPEEQKKEEMALNQLFKEENSSQFQPEASEKSTQKTKAPIIHLQDQIEFLQVPREIKLLLQDDVKKFHRAFTYIQEIMVEHCSNTTLLDKFQKILQTMVVFHQQFQQIVHILACIQHEECEKTLKIIFNKYQYLSEFRIPVQKKEQVNMEMVKFVSEILIRYLNELLQILKEFKNSQEIEEESSSKSLFHDLKIVYSKLYTILESIPHAITTDQSDLFSLPKTDPKWLKIQDFIHLKEIAPPEQLQKSLKKLKEKVKLANAMVYKGSEQDSTFKQSFVQNISAVYYFFASERSNRKADIFLADPKEECAFQIWNFLEHGFGKQALHLAFPTLKYYKKFFIHRRFMPITIEKVIQELKDDTQNQISKKEKNQILENPIQDFEMIKKHLHEKEEDNKYNRITVRFLLHETPFTPTPEQLENAKQNIQIYDLSSQQNQNIFEKMFNKQSHNIYKEIVIQIHGGGFVAMSSRTHQTYTRKWAKWLKVPIFCIDYRKAPEHPYPAALDDCWQAYNWILNYIEQFFNVIPERVVLVGDSAGGNLVTSLTALCIKHGVKVPDGIVLIYPALNLNSSSFTPSHIIALEDAILSHKLLKMCVNAYAVKNGEHKLNADRDPFLSPIHLSDQILLEFPPTRILVGTEDPLHDDSYRFLLKLRQLNKNVEMTEYKGLPHGFMNYDVPQGVTECEQCVQDACDYLSSLLFKN